MTGASILILLVVVINQAVVRDIWALSSADAVAANGATAEQVRADSAINDYEQRQQQQLRVLLPKLEQLKFRALDLMGRDDDHSSIELEKLAEAPRYEILRPNSLTNQPLSSQQQEDSSSLARLVSRIMLLNRSNELMRLNQAERKRNSRLSPNKEDKDYSFVLAMAPSAQRSFANYETPSLNNNNILQQHRATNNGKWPTQKLRDIIQSNEALR